MRLVRVAARCWRGLDTVELADLSPGLNLILGDNESGKSRVAQAIWFGLFESSKGRAAHKTALLSWDGVGEPSVEIELEVAGRVYRVEKVFGRATCTTTLQGPGVALRGEEAEGRLAEVLQISADGSGRPVRDEALGFWPLLWIRQFDSGQEPHRALTSSARARLQDLLADAVGEVAAGTSGHALWERAREVRAAYYTETGRPRGELAAAEADLEAARDALERVQLRIREREGAVDQLGVLRDDLEQQEQSLRRAHSGLEQARQAAAASARLRAEIERQKGAAAELKTELDAVAREQQLRSECEEGLKRVRAQIETVDRDRLAMLEPARVQVMEELATARAALASATRLREEARELARRAADHERRDRAEGAVTEERRRLEAARSQQRRLGQISAQIGAMRVSKERLAELRQTERSLETLQARLLGVSSQLILRALCPLTVDGAELQPGEERRWLCSEETSILLADTAELRLSPGGEDLPALRRDTRSLVEKREAHLRELGVDDLRAAEEQFSESERLQQERKGIEVLLAETCPGGVPAAEQRLAELTARLEALGPADPSAPTVDEAEARVAQIEQDEHVRRGVVEGLQQRVAEIEREVAADRATREAYTREAARLAERLQALESPEKLGQRAAAATTAWEAALATLRGMEARFRELGGERADDDVVRLQRDHEALRREHDDMMRRRASLETTLVHLSREGLHESGQEAAARLTELEAHAERVRRRAAAAQRLFATLEVCRAESQRRLFAPAVAAVGRYLQILFPGSTVSLDDEFAVAGLQTPVRQEPLPDLSGGTREQVGMVVRLGLAELLAGDERLPLVFDDALTNTDFRRARRMHQVLFEAAKQLQILVFSCHPEAFEGVGAGRRYRLPSASGR